MSTWAAPASPTPIQISPAEAKSAGMRVWKNECSGSVDGLTSWNVGEQFPSLGIGHFIWYPTGQSGRFQESFPELILFFKDKGVPLPDWLAQAQGCPWPDRQSFLADYSKPRLKELRILLADTVGIQTEFMAMRLQKALPKMLQAAPAQQRQLLESRFRNVLAQPGGSYCLLDYINFKGEGTNPKERYAGQGWGLLQVLEEMNQQTADLHPIQSFRVAAEKVLLRRIANSPPERGEQRWKNGWLNRLSTYGRE